MEGATMSNLFWLTVEQLAAIEAAIPTRRRGVKPRQNRAVISGIIHVLKIGCRWKDCPREYGPHTTIYNRFNRWSKAGIWAKILEKLVVFDATDIQCIDSTTAKAHRCAGGGKGGLRSRPSGGAGAGEPPKFTRSSMETDGSSRSN
jgi:transposase